MRSLLAGLRDRPRRVSVRRLWLEHERYTGRRVLTAGVVRAFEAGTPDEYFVLDDGPNRIGLRGDAGRLRRHLERRVRAVGTLTFMPGTGIFLTVDTVAPDA